MRFPRVLAAAVVLAAIVPASANAQTKIGFVNTERILRDSAPAAQASKRLESEFAKKQQDLQKLADQLKKMQSDLEKNAVTMSDAQRRSKEREFNELNRELQRRDRDFRDEVNQRRNEEMARQVFEHAIATGSPILFHTICADNTNAYAAAWLRANNAEIVPGADAANRIATVGAC